MVVAVVPARAGIGGGYYRQALAPCAIGLKDITSSGGYAIVKWTPSSGQR